ncbi:uncharacterized protein LOC127096385 [Lathyrus oleraceus]|uniref:uncharacterized protein LOC127096385 n=1 Tax=Pisum sativum TaxID=3888 RepID=UPI0021CFE7CB|nr:uncharacterized protein LOC127096385 [Pisum sativum]
MKVSVDLVLDTDALLPLPDVVSETTLMREAVGSFVGWPSDLIFPDAETPTRPTHKVGKGISRRIESVASLKEVPGRKLKKAGNDIPPTTSGTKSQIMMRLEKMVNESDIMQGVIRTIDFDEGASSWFHMGIDEALHMVMVTLLVCSGPMVGIQERVVGSIWESVKCYLW